MWRYRELLPVRNEANVVTLGEGMTRVLQVRRRVASALGFHGGRVAIKDEGKNPTGSFKARGVAGAISKGEEVGSTESGRPSAGHAGRAAAPDDPAARRHQ